MSTVELFQVTPYASNMKDVLLSSEFSSLCFMCSIYELAANIRIQTSLLNGSDVTVLHDARLALQS